MSSRNSVWRPVVFIGMFLILTFGFAVSYLHAFLLLFILHLVSGGWRFAKVVLYTMPRDMKALAVLIRLKLELYGLNRRHKNLVDVWHSTVQRHPDKACFLYETEIWSFRRVDIYSNQVANFMLENGFRPGDVVGLYLESRAQYVCLWLGCLKAGLITALLNFNLRGDSLLHSIRAANLSSLIFGTELGDVVAELHSSLKNTRLFSLGASGDPLKLVSSITNLDIALQTVSERSPPNNLHRRSMSDKLFYIFTSGTTGLPKAAIVSHFRYYYMARSIALFYHVTPNDIIYNSLPLYHSAGGILGTGQSVITGATLVIKRKFSASRFWDDCIQYNCTVAQYIGELCRYLLAQPERSSDYRHSVRLMFGNGLKPQIWSSFQTRFGVKQMGEFYGATEGNANLANPNNRVGAVGFLTRIFPSLYPVTLIRIDEATGQLMRDSRGLCVIAEPGEPGELVGKIVKHDPLRSFDGYSNQGDTDKKIARNVFHHGDLFFMSGDVLVMDEFGYLHFRDRTGDTFRWKGENVSTSEVEAVISELLHQADCAVVGVEVPGTEGCAGLAAIVTSSDFSDLNVILERLSLELPRVLPSYARPMFIRFMSQIESTSTFKLKKVDLRKEAFDPRLIKDPLFFCNLNQAGRYIRLDTMAYQSIQSGAIRF